MQPISINRPDLFSALTTTNTDLGNLNKTQFSQATLQVQKSTDFTLFTEEGDKVTLSSFSILEAGFATYNNQGFIDGAVSETSAEVFYLNQEFGIKLSVEGDLNQQELKDIRKALKTIEKLAHDFFSGRTDHAVKRASKLMRLETISGFEAILQYDRSASVQTASTQVLTPPASEHDQTVTSALIGPPISESVLNVEVEQLVEKITEVVVDSPVESETLAKHTNSFLEHLFVQFSQNNNESRFELQVIRQIQSEFIQRFRESGKG